LIKISNLKRLTKAPHDVSNGISLASFSVSVEQISVAIQVDVRSVDVKRHGIGQRTSGQDYFGTIRVAT
jgi:hypothetical protein